VSETKILWGQLIIVGKKASLATHDFQALIAFPVKSRRRREEQLPVTLWQTSHALRG
jgi:hypothetical protein